MTRYQYLQMRNRRRLPLQDMPDHVKRLFSRLCGRKTRFQSLGSRWPGGWGWVTWIALVPLDLTPSVIWRIHKQHRPAGLTDEDDPD